MRVLLVGSTSALGSAVATAVTARGHDVVVANLDEGEFQVDITDSKAIGDLLCSIGEFDAVACTIGLVPHFPLKDATREKIAEALSWKLISQADLALQSLAYLRPRGSITLLSGIQADVPWSFGLGSSIANRGLEGFVMAAAAELDLDRRINAVSPSITIESIETAGVLMPGLEPVASAKVAGAYLRSIEGLETGTVFKIFH